MIVYTGADPEIEEGGGIHMNWCGARRTQLSVRALASFRIPRPSRIRRLQYVAQKPENETTYIEHAQSGL